MAPPDPVPPPPVSTLTQAFTTIIKRLDTLESMQESVTRVEGIFLTLSPLLEQFATNFSTPPVDTAKIAELEAQVERYKADSENALAEWSKSEERVKQLEQRLNEAEASLSNLVASQGSWKDMAAELQGLANFFK